jgi:isopenicillin N synthase-like dioxygenase
MIKQLISARRLFSTASAGTLKNVQVIQVPYEVLTNHDSDEALEIIDRAYGENGIGTLAISGVPEYVEKRKKTLHEAWKLANLPREKRVKLERPEHFYQVGWEHGEYGFEDGRDAYMGSFFSNPLQDSFIGEDGTEWRNAWPEDDLPSLRPAVQDLSQTMKRAAHHLAKHLDKYVQIHLPSFERNFFSNTIANTPKVNSRLIHYYPCNKDFTG